MYLVIWLFIGVISSAYAIYDDGLDVKDIPFIPLCVAAGPIFALFVIGNVVITNHSDSINTLLAKKLVRPRKERK